MAQEFKEYDKKYIKSKGKGFVLMDGTDADIASYLQKNSWYDFIPTWTFIVHGQVDVRDAVYKAEGFEEWQKLRVSLHGLTTRAKLWCLMKYYERKRNDYWRRIRIDNYLGALIRGGILDEDLKVLK